MKALKILQSSDAMLFVLSLALFAQMPHAQYVFYESSKELGAWGVIVSWAAAIALELAVLLFVVRAQTAQSWGFAAFSVAINLVYYTTPDIAWYTPKAQWLLSAGLPVAIALYSHEVAGKHAVQTEPVQPTAQQATRTRTQRTVQVAEQTEQYTVVEPHNAQLPSAQLPVITVQPEPHTAQAESVQLDFSSMTTAQKKAHVWRLLDGKEAINQSQLSTQLDVRRQTISAWVKAHSEQEVKP